MKPRFILLLCIGLVLIVMLGLAKPVRAFEGRGGDTVIIPTGEVIEDDLYVAANIFTLQGIVKGDVIVVGSTITISGTVEGDLIAAGQSVIVNGQVMDDIRMAGAAVVLGENAQVTDDLVAAGYSVESKDGSSVGGDSLIVGYQVLMAGDTAQDAKVAANKVQLSGSVGGDLNVEVGASERMPTIPPATFMPNMPVVPTIPAGLTIKPGSSIGGNLTYTSPQEALIPPGAVSGNVVHQFPVVETGKENTAAEQTSNWLFINLRNIVSLLIVGLLMVWLVPKFVQNGANAVKAKPLPSFGWGIVTVIGFFLAFLAIMAVVGILAVFFGIVTLGELLGTVVWAGIIAVAVLIFTFSISVGYISKIIVSYLGGRLILARIKPEWTEKPYWSLVLGVVIFAILVAIPFLGGLVNFIVVLMGLGALWLLGWELIRSRSAVVKAPAESTD